MREENKQVSRNRSRRALKNFFSLGFVTLDVGARAESENDKYFLVGGFSVGIINHSAAQNPPETEECRNPSARQRTGLSTPDCVSAKTIIGLCDDRKLIYAESATSD